MAEWEYKIHEGPLCESGLNYLGSDGWELVSVQREAELTYYFKRPVQFDRARPSRQTPITGEVISGQTSEATPPEAVK